MPQKREAVQHAPMDSGPKPHPLPEIKGLGEQKLSGPQPMKPQKLIPARQENA